MKCVCFLVSESHNYSKTTTFPSCATKHCITISIEDKLGITSTQRVDINLGSTDDRITLQQTSGHVEINRIFSMCDNCN